MRITLHGSSVCMRASFQLHVIHAERLIVRFLLFISVIYLFSSLSYLYSDLHSFHVNSAKGNNREEYCPLAIYHPPTGYDPNLLDDFHYSKTEMIFQEESGDKDTEPSYLSNTKLDDEAIGKA